MFQRFWRALVNATLALEELAEGAKSGRDDITQRIDVDQSVAGALPAPEDEAESNGKARMTRRR